MSDESIRIARILPITVPTIALGGARLLRAIWSGEPGYLDNPVRQNFWRAGHPHAGVLVILALIRMLYVDRAGLSEGLGWVVRLLLVIPRSSWPSASSSRRRRRGL